MLNTEQYLQMRREAFANDGISPTADEAPDLFLWDTTRYTDWQKNLDWQYSSIYKCKRLHFRGNTCYPVHSKRHLSAGDLCIPRKVCRPKGAIHFSINSTTTNQKLNFQLSGNYLVDKNQLPVSDLTYNAIALEPVAPALHNADGSLNWMPNAYGSSTWQNLLRISTKPIKITQII